MKRVFILAPIVLALIFGAISSDGPAQAAGVTFTVNSTFDGILGPPPVPAVDADPSDGVCDYDLGTPGEQCGLRAAIEQANNTPDKDTIAFNIPTIDPAYSGYDTWEIEPVSPLPVIGNPVIIDGRTQPQFVDRPVILLCGISAGANVDGLRITSGNTTVRGLVISRFGILPSDSNGIEIQGPFGSNIIEGNYIGVNAAPDPDNPCGGTLPKVTGTETDPDGEPTITPDGDEWGNAGSGIFINGSPNNVIGGTDGTTPGACTGSCNLISGAGRGSNSAPNAHGIQISGSGATGNVVLGNWIGINAGGGPEFGAFCADNLDSDGDSVVNDGCPVNSPGTAETGGQCANSSDDDSDGVTNDGCPANPEGTAETGGQCANSSDDDSDGVTNDGCAANTPGAAETDCAPAESAPLDDDSDGVVNDGCPAVGGAETGQQCADSIDNDNDDGIGGSGSLGDSINDGCPAALDSVPETGTQCANSTDTEDNYPETPVTIENDGLINDGCPVALESVPEAGEQCAGATDTEDNYSETPAAEADGLINDGCPVALESVPETGSQCSGATDTEDNYDETPVTIEKDGLVNDGCPMVMGVTKDFGNEGDGININGASNNTIGGSAAGARNVITANDNVAGGGVHIVGGPEAGAACTGSADNDGDGVINDGCPKVGATAESGAQCANAISDDDDNGDSVINLLDAANDGCPAVKVASGNHVEGNFIGTTPDGLSIPPPPAGKSLYGVVIDGAPGNTIGGTSGTTAGGPCTGACNVVSASVAGGILIQGAGATGNLVQGSYVGLDVTGTLDLGSFGSGVILDNSSSNNTIGGTAAAAGNVVSGNNLHGIEINDATTTGNLIQGNFIGTNASATGELGNGLVGGALTGRGIRINAAAGNTIGAPGGGRNVISGNIRFGIEISGASATGNVVKSNYIGTNATATGPLGNRESGVLVSGAPGNTIGGTTSGAGNVISGNGQASVMFVAPGVWILGSGATGTLIQGNLIGTNVSGTAPLSNLGIGVLIAGSPNNTVGGTTAAARNIISGNGIHGVEIDSAGGTGNLVRGNYIGLNASGNAGLGNGGDGVFISDAPGNSIGGTAGGSKNVISANGSMGVEVLGIASSGNLVQGNYVGTDLNGGIDLGNAQHGVFINGAPDNAIGGTTAAARNVISGNNGTGVFIQGGGATSNDILGNYVGTNAAGTADVGNSSDGVRLGGDAGNNDIGGPNAADANIIAFNGGDGISIDATGGTGNRIQRSTIFSNDGLGIDLFHAADPVSGVTPNDTGDGDTGPNNLQNYPDVTSASSTVTGTTIAGSFNSTPDASFSIYFFADDSCDLSGFGEGRTFVGSTVVNTVGQNANFNVNFPAVVYDGYVVTATATDSAGNTSEFSQCQPVTGVAPPPPTPTPSPSPTPGPTPEPGALTQGDVDCSAGGNPVTSVDALKVLRYGASLAYAQNEPCPDIGTMVSQMFGDVDCDGNVNAVDALKLLRFGASLAYAQNEPCVDIGQALP